MQLLQGLLVSGLVPSLGTFHKALTELTIAGFSLFLSSNFFKNTILNPLGCLYIATSSLHTYTTLSRLRPSLKILILLGPSTVPRSQRLLCIISSRLLPLYGLSSPTSSLQLSASCLNPNSRRS